MNIMKSTMPAGSSLGYIAWAILLITAGCSGSPGVDGAVGGNVGTGGSAPGATGGVTATGGKTSSSAGGNATGGSSATGGTTGSAGAPQVGGSTATGGTAATGGQSTTGGASPTGGKNSTGGASASGGKSSTGGANPTGGVNSSGGANPTGGKSSTGGASATGGKTATGGASATGGKTATGGATGTGGSTSTQQCTSALPALAQPVNVSSPTSVVGTGTAASCTFSALNTAVTKGGIITFNCGTAPVTIPITATMNLLTTKDTVIDGGSLVTLDGGGAVQILNYNSANFRALDTRVTLQHLTLINGKTTPTEVIPTAPSPCSQGYNDGEGGALYMRDGNLTVIDCTFTGNQAAPLGPDTGGGAIYILGSKNGAIIVGSTFTNNQASNAGAVGGLFAELDIYNSVFQNNKAIGNGANSDDSTKCSVINNGQHEVGSGGNGGAIYQDGGSSTNVILCGDTITGNAAGTGAFGGGVFMTSNDWTGTITIRDTTITGNTGGHWTQLQQGSVTNLGSAFGINALSATVTNSTLQP